MSDESFQIQCFLRVYLELENYMDTLNDNLNFESIIFSQFFTIIEFVKEYTTKGPFLFLNY